MYLHARASLGSHSCEQLLDLGDGKAGVQALQQKITKNEKLALVIRDWTFQPGVDFIKVGRTVQIIEIALLKLGARRQALDASKKLLKSWV